MKKPQFFFPPSPSTIKKFPSVLVSITQLISGEEMTSKVSLFRLGYSFPLLAILTRSPPLGCRFFFSSSRRLLPVAPCRRQTSFCRQMGRLFVQEVSFPFLRPHTLPLSLVESDFIDSRGRGPPWRRLRLFFFAWNEPFFSVPGVRCLCFLSVKDHLCFLSFSWVGLFILL